MGETLNDRPGPPVREAVEVFREEYARNFMTGANEGDHDESIRAGIEAVLEMTDAKLRAR